MCLFHSKQDFVLTGRKSTDEGDVFDVPDSEYADDTAVLFVSRASLVASTPSMIEHFARFGMSIHVGRGDQKSKSEVLFVSAPLHCYTDPESFDGMDVSNILLGDGSFIPVVDQFCYLGSLLTRDCRDDADVTKCIAAAGGHLGHCVNAYFRRPS